MDLAMGYDVVRERVERELCGEQVFVVAEGELVLRGVVGAEESVTTKVIVVGSGNVTVEVLHAGRGSASRVECVALGRGTVRVTVLTRVPKGNAEAVAVQQIRGIPLTEGAEVVVDPRMDIAEDEVAAARHGAAVGGAAKEEVGFLVARGISEEQARHMLAVGAVEKLLDGCTEEEKSAVLALLC